MPNTLRKFFQSALTAVELGHRIVRGIDYETLSQYILRINKHRDIDSILLEVSSCLQEILDYELFGFALKRNNTIDVWIDPKAYSAPLSDRILQDFNSQNIDLKMHFFEKKEAAEGHNSDTRYINNLISYKVIDSGHIARLYILPRKKMLAHHDSIISTIISSISIAVEKNLSIEQLESAAAIDPLTSCYNRRALDVFIERDIAFARRHNQELSVIMFDLDDFKVVNDCHGHLAGDLVLQQVSGLIPALVRRSDYVARYGGEEFVLVLRDTGLYAAVQLAHKLRKLIEERGIEHNGQRLTVTASMGVASLERKQDGASLLREADERLYESKRLGKNTVIPSMLPFFADSRRLAKAAANAADRLPVAVLS